VTVHGMRGTTIEKLVVLVGSRLWQPTADDVAQLAAWGCLSGRQETPNRAPRTPSRGRHCRARAGSGRMRAMRRFLLSIAMLVGCGGDAEDVIPDGGPGDPDAPGACARQPAAADRTRHVVVAHPYLANGDSSPMYEVLELSAAGTLTRFAPPRLFSLGARTPFGVIAFTPDGEVGLVAMDNGDLGVFRLDASGMPTVVHASFDGAFYASRVIVDRAGDRAWVIDRNTRPNGGGIYAVAIGCDGTLTDQGQVAAARSPGGLAFTGTQWVIAARDILDSPVGDDLHLLDLASPAVRRGGGDAFGDDDQAFSGFALSRDGATAFIGDSNFAGPNRVGIATVTETGVSMTAIIPNITDPTAIATSPHGDVAVVSSSQPPGEGIYVLDRGGPDGAWRNRGELTYVGPAAQLPGDMTTIDRGALAGRVLVSELSNVRQLLFHATGEVEDVGSVSFGDGLENIGGAIGVTP
jgi:hypothetical protein